LKKKDNPVKKKKSIVGILVLFFIILVVLVCGYNTYRFVTDNQGISAMSSNKDKTGNPIKIVSKSSTSDIASVLKKENLIRSTFLFKVLSKLNGYDGKYKAGTFKIDRSINYNNLNGYDLLMKKLTSSPEKEPGLLVTIPEGKTFKETEDILSNSGLINISKFTEIANNQKLDFDFLKDVPHDRENRLEGYLFPDTYNFNPKGGEKEVITRCLNQFDVVFKPEYYTRSKELNMTTDQIIILASIIEREAKSPDERSIIAGVLYNRLHNKNKTLRRLQVDATIQYALLNSQGSVKERLSLDDLKMDTPYNTYLYEGLPPGPICSPGAESIKAALYPQKNDYIYYVAKDDGSGTHYFSKTYKEHLIAKAKAKRNRTKGK